METNEVIHNNNLLTAKMTVKSKHCDYDTNTSDEMIIGGTAVFQVRLVSIMLSQGVTSFLFVRFGKRDNVNDNLTYKIFVKSAELRVEGTLSSNDYAWHLIHENKARHFSFTITAKLLLQPSPRAFASLHNDERLVDFELRGEDGSVRVHRAVLASASPVLQGMLSGAWRETAEGAVDVAGTSKDTLEAFKNFVYLHVLPESGLEQLLQLAAFYDMPELERLCVDRLVLGMTVQNMCDLIQFASSSQMMELLITVLERVQDGHVNVKELRTHMMRRKQPSKPEPELEPQPSGSGLCLFQKRLEQS